jgi:tripartite-type tricarboxylate transporter receptor subunit TctC
MHVGINRSLISFKRRVACDHEQRFEAADGSHLVGELFKQLAGIDIVHVPYRGAAPALTDLMAGRVQMMFDSMTSALTHVQGGKLTALAVSTATRSSLLPDVPTMAEAGVDNFTLTNWYGFWRPKELTPAHHR